MIEEKSLTNSSESSEESLKKSYSNNSNFKNFARGHWLVVGDAFFEFRQKGIFDHVQFSVALMLHRWSYQNYKLRDFEMSRRELAKIANCGDKQAQDTLQILVTFCFLDEIYKQKGAHSRYRWNVDNIVDAQTNLGRIDPTPGSSSIRHMGLIASGPDAERPNTYIKEYIKLVFLLKARAQLQTFVEEFTVGADAPEFSGNISVADYAAGPECDAVMASWSEAIEVCCRAYGYDRVHLIIKNHAVRYFRESEPRKALARLCRDSDLISELRERFPHFKTNKDFATFASKDFKRVSAEYHAESIPFNQSGGSHDTHASPRQ